MIWLWMILLIPTVGFVVYITAKFLFRWHKFYRQYQAWAKRELNRHFWKMLAGEEEPINHPICQFIEILREVLPRCLLKPIAGYPSKRYIDDFCGKLTKLLFLTEVNIRLDDPRYPEFYCIREQLSPFVEIFETLAGNAVISFALCHDLLTFSRDGLGSVLQPELPEPKMPIASFSRRWWPRELEVWDLHFYLRDHALSNEIGQ